MTKIIKGDHLSQTTPNKIPVSEPADVGINFVEKIN